MLRAILTGALLAPVLLWVVAVALFGPRRCRRGCCCHHCHK